MIPPSEQLPLLFDDNLFAAARVSFRDATHWHDDGLLSFEPDPKDIVEAGKLRELTFLRDLMRVEWSVNAVHRLLAGLPRPYAYSHRAIFYDFGEGFWRRHWSCEGLVSRCCQDPDQASDAMVQMVQVLKFLGCDKQLRRVKLAIESSSDR